MTLGRSLLLHHHFLHLVGILHFMTSCLISLRSQQLHVRSGLFDDHTLAKGLAAMMQPLLSQKVFWTTRRLVIMTIPEGHLAVGLLGDVVIRTGDLREG